MVRQLSGLALILWLLIAAATGYAAETEIINIYDANGNLVTGDGRYYEYNDANQLARVRQGDQAGPVIAEYVYDAAGQRVKKIENGVVTYYVGRHYEKQVGGSNVGNTSYYFGEGGERVAKKDPAGNIFYYHLDHLDGINVVTNSTGTEVSRTDYLPFGDLRTGSSNSEKYSFTGKEKDKTSLYYFNARYNSPEIRHFTQADIAEPEYDDPQDLNRYAYVGNNPLSYVDYDGFKKKKKKAKLSKREKWMIAHGVDPDKDKTSLKKAKKLLKEGKKYTTVAKATTATVNSATYNGLVGGNLSLNEAETEIATTNKFTKVKIRSALMQAAAYRAEELAWRQHEVNILEGTYKALGSLNSLLCGDLVGAFGGILDQSSQLAKLVGYNKASAILSVASKGIDAYGLYNMPKNFTKVVDTVESGQNALKILSPEEIVSFINTGSTIFNTGYGFIEDGFE